MCPIWRVKEHEQGRLFHQDSFRESVGLMVVSLLRLQPGPELLGADKISWVWNGQGETPASATRL